MRRGFATEIALLHASFTLICTFLLALMFVACTEPRVVRSTDMLAGLPGAQGGIQAEGSSVPLGQSWDQLLTQFGQPNQTGGNGALIWEPAANEHLREVTPQGDVRLISKAPSHVMFHLSQTLRNEEYDLILDQVLSKRTKQVYQAQGRDPREAVGYLKQHEQDIAELFASVPLGEQTPGVLMQDLGDNAFRLRAPSALAGGMRFSIFDVVIENGSFRLLMIR